MVNVSSDEKKQQVIVLGRLGWTLRRIQQATGVRRETASAYLKAAGIAVRLPGGWGRRAVPKPANEVITDFGVGKPAAEVFPDPVPRPLTPPGSSDSAAPKPALGVITDLGPSVPLEQPASRLDRTPPTSEVITDPGAEPAPAPERAVPPTRSPSASACEPYRELVELGLARG